MMVGSADGRRQYAGSTTIDDTPDPAAAVAAWDEVTTTALCGPQPAAPAPTSAPAPAPVPAPAPLPDLARTLW
ncbi:hypothetical protein AB0D10_14785 [Kitasatospora sp. NPDC048545]|uniref:hypothetical protein n=1 Tax=Kitasatospora sp. NPDC048545 TaxID=3157208 RepID=UPI0033E8974C